MYEIGNEKSGSDLQKPLLILFSAIFLVVAIICFVIQGVDRDQKLSSHSSLVVMGSMFAAFAVILSLWALNVHKNEKAAK